MENKKIQIKIVGYTNLQLLGKKQTLKVYKTKQGAKVAAAKLMIKAKIKASKKFVEDIANVIKGEALKAKLWAANRMLRLKGYCWNRYINVCNALRLIRIFNSSVSRDLKVNFN